MRLPRFQVRRVTIAEVMVAIAAIACAFTWPVLTVPTAGGLVTAVFHKLGFTLIASLAITCMLFMLLALCLPPISSHG